MPECDGEHQQCHSLIRLAAEVIDEKQRRNLEPAISTQDDCQHKQGAERGGQQFDSQEHGPHARHPRKTMRHA
jgi:hypothetical protein